MEVVLQGMETDKVTKTILIAFLVAVTTAYAAPTFTQKPTVTKKGAGAEISFAVGEPTDVAVYVLDAKGKVIRHLSAGVLGPKAAAPLAAGSLAQMLTWDGKDNDDKLASGAPFRVRVGLGLRPTFDRFLMYNPDALPRLSCIVAGLDGEFYLFHADAVSNGNQGGLKIRVWNREGKYKRMLMPYPADLPYEQVKALDAFRDEEGRLVPRLQNYQTLSLLPDVTGVRGRSLHTGSPAVDSKGGVHWMIRGGRIVSLDSRGGCSYDSLYGPKLFPDQDDFVTNDRYSTERACLAVGEGDKRIYVSGLNRGRKKNVQAVPCVYRVNLAARDKAEVFVGDPDKPGADGKLLTAPKGVICAGGVLYVADAGANRVIGFSETDGSIVGEFRTTAPHFIGIDPRNGTLYVIGGKEVTAPNLTKFDGIKTGKKICTVALPKSSHTTAMNHSMAVDASAKPVRVWVAVKAFKRYRVCAVDDEGTKLTVDDGFLARMSKWKGIPQDLEMDRDRDELYVRGVYRIDDETGKIKAKLFEGKAKRDLAWGGYTVIPMADSSLVSFGNGKQGGLKRWTREGKPLAWEGAPDNSPKPTGVLESIMTLGPVGGITPHGNDFYIVSPKDNKGQTTLLNVHGLDGKQKRTVVWGVNVRSHPRVDARGNIYLAAPVKTRGKFAPAFFDDKLDPKQELRSYRNSYNYLYGSIVKFPPTGGAMYYTGGKGDSYAPSDVPAEIKKKPTLEFSYPTMAFGSIANGTAQGAEWIRMGFAPFSSKWGGGTAFCHCENSGFDVDPFGRVFYPNLGQFRVEVVDTGNNMIGTFGHYGNQDSGGPNATVKTPEIPLAWPAYVAVSDKYAYVSDSINLRIVRVKLDYEAEATVDVK